MLVVKNKPKLWTRQGLQNLGEFVRLSRRSLGRRYGKERGFSQRDLEDFIKQKTGHELHNTTLSGLERAINEPTWNTIAILAAAEILLKSDGTPYSVEELSDIICEEITPPTPPFDELEANNDLIVLQYYEVGDNVYSFTPSQQERLRQLVNASKRALSLSRDAFIQRCINGTDLTFKEMLLLYSDIQDGTIRIHTKERIEALLPMLFKVRVWKGSAGVELDPTKHYGNLEELERDLSNGDAPIRNS